MQLSLFVLPLYAISAEIEVALFILWVCVDTQQLNCSGGPRKKRRRIPSLPWQIPFSSDFSFVFDTCLISRRIPFLTGLCAKYVLREEAEMMDTTSFLEANPDNLISSSFFTTHYLSDSPPSNHGHSSQLADRQTISQKCCWKLKWQRRVSGNDKSVSSVSIFFLFCRQKLCQNCTWERNAAICHCWDGITKLRLVLDSVVCAPCWHTTHHHH